MNILYDVTKMRMIQLKQEIEDLCRRRNAKIKWLEFRMCNDTPSGYMTCCAKTFTMVWHDINIKL